MHRLPALVFAAIFALPAFAKGDPARGKEARRRSKCEICHNNKVMGEPGAIYLRKDRKVTSHAKLKSQVSLCTTQLSLPLFPEDEEHIVSYLNKAWYKFSEPK